MNHTLPLALGLAIACSAPGLTQSRDPDGCYEVPDGCLAINTRWQGEELVARVNNSCPGQIIAQICLDRPGRADFCRSVIYPEGRRVDEIFLTSYGPYSGDWTVRYIGTETVRRAQYCGQSIGMVRPTTWTGAWPGRH